MKAEEVFELIKSRRSVRKFEDKPVDPQMVEMVLEAGRWAPSGLNNQPWRFVVVTGSDTKAEVAVQTRYSQVILNAPVVIGVFIHKPSMYHEVKDYQSMGACLENMLLMAHGLGLGAVWLGEILKNAAEVRRIMGASEEHDLMAVLALGHPASQKQAGKRQPMDELVLDRR